MGQCAREKQRILVRDVPENYIRIQSSLGSGTPTTIVVLPVLFEGEVKAVVELASFHKLSEVHVAFLDQLTESIGIVLNTIAATMRTEQLLQQSQALAEELQKTNAELQEKAQLLAEQNTEVEAKNREIEQAKHALEEKAEQLALTSKYKSEFLANMSHELRTPLNNLLILARVLADNTEGNLSPKQIKFAETIHSSGTDLLALINDILDLSKIESGKMDVEVGNVRFAELEDYCVRTFRHVAEGKGIGFGIEVQPDLSSGVIRTDVKRLQQVLKNLLSNALKFTEQGSVKLRMETVTSGWSRTHTVLNRAKGVIAFSVTDTGIGIAHEKQRIIFEAFQQADGTTSRKYGGTGLGLSISRELARLLGGEIHLQSAVGRGSVFTFYLPQTYIASAPKPEGPDRPLALSDGELRSRGDLDLILAPSGDSGAGRAGRGTRGGRRPQPGRARRPRAVDRRRRRDIRANHGGYEPSLRRQGDRRIAGDNGDLSGARIPAGRHHLGSAPAGHERLDAAGPAEARFLAPRIFPSTSSPATKTISAASRWEPCRACRRMSAPSHWRGSSE